MFMECLKCTPETSELARVIYYIPFIMIFQIGWACVQISHLALIPELARADAERTILNGIR